VATTLRVLTPEQAAKVLQLSPRTVYSYLRQGKLPGRKIGGRRWRILEEDIRAYIRGDWPPEELVEAGMVAAVEELATTTTDDDFIPWDEAKKVLRR